MIKKQISEEAPEEEIFDNSGKIKPFSSRAENELYDDNDYVVHRLIQVKRVTLPKNGENWEIMNNDEVVLVIRGIQLTEKQRMFLRTPDGFNYLLKEFKSGNKSFTKIKSNLTKHLKK